MPLTGQAFKVFIGLAAASNGSNGYTLWASGGADSDVKVFNVSSAGIITPDPTTPKIPIAPITPPDQGFVSNYNTTPASWTGKPVPTGFSTSGAHITFPAGCTLSPDGKYLYVACNGDDSVAVIDTGSKTVVKQVPVGYFPYGVSVTADGKKVAVSNWGVTEYKFANPTYSLRPADRPGDHGNRPSRWLLCPGAEHNRQQSPKFFRLHLERPGRRRLQAGLDELHLRGHRPWICWIK